MTLSQRIIIVDDERSVRNGLSNLLESEGYATAAFSSAEALLNDDIALADAAFFIIDVRLKGQSGLELFRELCHRLRKPLGILISGDSDEDMSWRALESGAVAFLAKPIEIDMLFYHIRRELTSGETD